MRDTVAALEELEKEFRGTLGDRRFDDFVNVAAELYRAVALEEELSETHAFVTPQPDPAGPNGRAPRDRELRAIASLLEEKLGASAANRLGRILSN